MGEPSSALTALECLSWRGDGVSAHMAGAECSTVMGCSGRVWRGAVLGGT